MYYMAWLRYSRLDLTVDPPRVLLAFSTRGEGGLGPFTPYLFSPRDHRSRRSLDCKVDGRRDREREGKDKTYETDIDHEVRRTLERCNGRVLPRQAWTKVEQQEIK